MNPQPVVSAGISFKSLKMNGVYEYDMDTRAGDCCYCKYY
jgi:hypothetical protein